MQDLEPNQVLDVWPLHPMTIALLLRIAIVYAISKTALWINCNRLRTNVLIL